MKSQHPDLEGPLEAVGSGWDNVMFRLGSFRAVRLPRRASAVELIEKELKWLPLLAPLLPLAVPLAVRQGSPGPLFPWAWSIGPWPPWWSVPIRTRTCATARSPARSRTASTMPSTKPNSCTFLVSTLRHRSHPPHAQIAADVACGLFVDATKEKRDEVRVSCAGGAVTVSVTPIN